MKAAYFLYFQYTHPWSPYIVHSLNKSDTALTDQTSNDSHELFLVFSCSKFMGHFTRTVNIFFWYLRVLIV